MDLESLIKEEELKVQKALKRLVRLYFIRSARKHNKDMFVPSEIYENICFYLLKNLSRIESYIDSIFCALKKQTPLPFIDEECLETKIMSLDDYQKFAMRVALEEHKGNRTKAAVSLGISLRGMRNLMGVFGLNKEYPVNQWMDKDEKGNSTTCNL